MTATYNHPSLVQTKVVSLTHFVLGALAVKSLPRILGAATTPACLRVPTGLFRVALAHNSISRIKRAVRSREQRIPRSRNSA